ncbi:hypothetical protein SLA2020_384380 [Shorea laevis]
MAVSSSGRVLITAELEGPKPNGGVPPSRPWLAVRKPSWVVRTESNVRKEKKKKPDPPCVVCHGSGRVNCHQCYGKGRTNHVHLTMLPKGEWPKWCKTCGGSGLGYCSRCLGSGEYRYIMGFKFMNVDADHNNYPTHREPGKQASLDWLLGQDENDSGS